MSNFGLKLPSVDTFAVYDCLLVLGALGINLKIALFNTPMGQIAMFVDKGYHPGFSQAGELGFLLHDIALNIFIMPIIATSVLGFLFRRYRVMAAALMAALLIVIYFYQLIAFHEVGQFMSRDLIADSVRWELSNPTSTGDYLNASRVLKLMLLFGALGAIVFFARVVRRDATMGKSIRVNVCRWLLVVPPVGICVVCAVLIAIGLANIEPRSTANASAVGTMAATMFQSVDDGGTAITASLSETIHAVRKLTRTPSFDAHNRFIGSERGANTIFFIMETGPARALDFATSGADLPGTGPLFNHAFVARRHYTTYPYTSDAVYSILTSLYPKDRRRLLRDPELKSVDTLMTALRGTNPVRRVYLPSLYRAEVDDRMYKVFGAETLFVSDAHGTDPLRKSAEKRADELIAALGKSGGQWGAEPEKLLRTRLVYDFQALEEMKRDIVAAAKSNQHYCMMYLPQIAHGPWLALHSEATALERGRNLMRLEDLWLKEIVDTVRSVGLLDNTVIVVTADHGVRALAEDPHFEPGKISSYMFRVPLLVYAPMALDHTQYIDAPSSHIDLAPTVLALLGNTGALDYMEGVPLWQRGPHQRIYFNALAYGGADGYVEGGEYFMRQAMWHTVYASSTFSFDYYDLLGENDPRAIRAKHALDRLYQLQETVVTGLGKQ